MHNGLPDEGDVWERYDGVRVRVMVLRADRAGRYARVARLDTGRTGRVALETFTLGGGKAWRYVPDA